jgi:methylmalonyl-CoA mutase
MDTKENTEKLFSEFPPIATDQWEERIIEDLKGADYEKKLIWKTPEGISVKPYYRSEHVSDLPWLADMPGAYPFIRGNKTYDNSWLIRQSIEVSNLKEANRIALNALAKGANALSLNVAEVESAESLMVLLNEISVEATDIHFFGSRNYPALLNHLMAWCKSQNLSGQNLKGSFDYDPISYVLLHGDFYHAENADLLQGFELLKIGLKFAPNFRFITVNGHYFPESGSNLVQQLAFAMASASEYAAYYTSRGIDAAEVINHINFIFGTGGNYFMEIAGLRAARLLWARIAAQYMPEASKQLSISMHAVTANYNKTVYDPYVNMLRTTTEAMAAAVAGVDSLTVNPFDAPFKEADDFSRRIARNQQILLKEESYLDKVIDPSAGSYYIEQLTDSIAAHAWKLFVQVEAMGGMLKAVKEGFVQDEVEKNTRQRKQDLAARRQVLLGTNQYPNQDERMLDKIQADDAQPEDDSEEAPRYKTLKTGRLADEFEDLRLATEIFTEEGNPQPAVFLFTMGNLTMRKARAAFSSGFFGCGGYKIVDNIGFKTVEDGIAAVQKHQPAVVVICSSDEEYPSLVPEICKQLKEAGSDAIPVLAGYPKELVEQFQQHGIQEFIHMRSNLHETLNNFHQKLGIVD